MKECFNCYGRFKDEEMQWEEIPSNFIVHTSKYKKEVPKCPLCGAVAFLNFKDIKVKE